MPSSPSTPRRTRPLPFTAPPPPMPQPAPAPPLAAADDDAPPDGPPPLHLNLSHLAQQPAAAVPAGPPSAHSSTFHPSGQYYRNAVHEVHSVLYSQKGRDREEIARVVGELYDAGACFENPLTLCRGRQAIGDMFALLALVPGTMWSEMGDITDSQGYDGNRLYVFTHTLHISLLPFLDSENAPVLPGTSAATPSMRRSYSFFSLPATPYAQTPSAQHASLNEDDDDDASPGIFSKTHPSFPNTRWPSTSLLSLLNPRTIASSLTTLHLKLHTRLLFNEEGRIIAHEDLWGLKELVEGVFPVVGHLYAINRQGLAWAAGLASRTLLGSRKAPLNSAAEEQKHLLSDKERDLEAGYPRTPERQLPPLSLSSSSRPSVRSLFPDLTGGGASLEPPRALPSNGLGLVEQKAVPNGDE
ncbi:hypothetical protein JCM6882_006722 [Rhodosporidiobolus microsporus]